MLANTKDLTDGPTLKLIVGFALPVLLSQLFQQLYNTADSLIVGRVLGTQALAAVTAASNMVFLLTSFFTGLSLGAGIAISCYFGAGDDQMVNDAVHTNILVGIICGIALSVTGALLTPYILRWMRVDLQFMDLAVEYYRLYFAGSFAVVMYNLALGSMQALGDSRRPLYYLIFSSVLNIILDYIAVAVIGWGVWSAAVATIISQMISAVLCIIHLSERNQIYSLSFRKLKIHKVILKDMVKFGIPSGIANSVIGIANVIVQSSINSFGMYASAAFGAHLRVDGFGFLPITSFTMALSTFVSQNLGAKKYERAKKGANQGILISVCLAEVIGIFVFIFTRKIIGIFDSNPEVIEIGAMAEHIVMLFYLFLSFSHAVAAVCRGAGKAAVPMYVMLGDWCIFRVIYITIVMKVFGKLNLVFWAYPITWIISTVIFGLYYLKSDWIHGLDKAGS